MKNFHKKVVLLLVIQSLILLAFMFLLTTKTVTNVSALETEGIGVYWNSNCTERRSSINWGTLTPRSVKNIPVYIRNEGEKSMRLLLSTSNWTPPEAFAYLNLGWNYPLGRWINPWEILQITLSLSVSPSIEGISSFGFDILITGDDSLLGDLDGDGVIDVGDLGIMLRVYYQVPGWEDWETAADLNGDGVLDIGDLACMIYVYSGLL